MENFTVSIFGAHYIDTRHQFLDKLTREGVCFYNSKKVEEKQDPSENDQYYLVNSDCIVVVVDDPSDAKTIQDIDMVLEYVKKNGKPTVFVLSNYGWFKDERNNYYPGIDRDLKRNKLNPLRSLDDALSFILEQRDKKLASLEAQEEEVVDVKLDENGQKVSVSTPTDAE